MKRNYFAFLLSALTFIGFQQANAQCVADAGTDIVLCDGDTLSNFSLGGAPTAVGATNPIYTWSATYSDVTGTYHASDFLDDTTAANPNFIGEPTFPDSVKFVVLVEDNQIVPITCTDSVYVSRSVFNYGLVQLESSINPGDTISIFHNVIGGFGDLSVTWFPDYNIDSVNSHSPMVSPDTSVKYFFVVTDEGNCSADTGFYQVNVNPVSLAEGETVPVINYPNPFVGFTTIDLSSFAGQEVIVSIYNNVGQLVATETSSANKLQLGGDLAQGSYVIVISNNETVLSRGIVQKL